MPVSGSILILSKKQYLKLNNKQQCDIVADFKESLQKYQAIKLWLQKNWLGQCPRKIIISLMRRTLLIQGICKYLKRCGFKIMENYGTALKACLVYCTALGACII